MLRSKKHYKLLCIISSSYLALSSVGYGHGLGEAQLVIDMPNATINFNSGYYDQVSLTAHTANIFEDKNYCLSITPQPPSQFTSITQDGKMVYGLGLGTLQNTQTGAVVSLIGFEDSQSNSIAPISVINSGLCQYNGAFQGIIFNSTQSSGSCQMIFDGKTLAKLNRIMLNVSANDTIEGHFNLNINWSLQAI